MLWVAQTEIVNLSSKAYYENYSANYPNSIPTSLIVRVLHTPIVSVMSGIADFRYK